MSGRPTAARRASCFVERQHDVDRFAAQPRHDRPKSDQIEARNLRGNTKYSRSSSEPRKTRLSLGNSASSSSKPTCRMQSRGAGITTGSPKSSR